MHYIPFMYIIFFNFILIVLDNYLIYIFKSENSIFDEHNIFHR